MKSYLVDTGPLVAYLNRRDEAHESVKQFLRQLKGHLATTNAVISEVMYFVSEHSSGPFSFAQFLLASRMHISDMCQPTQVHEAVGLMSRYSDIPMDFADATLVLLGDAMGTTDILTLDRRGFSTYRTAKGKTFHIVG